jgi:hypothetical protein
MSINAAVFVSDIYRHLFGNATVWIWHQSGIPVNRVIRYVLFPAPAFFTFLASLNQPALLSFEIGRN